MTDKELLELAAIAAAPQPEPNPNWCAGCSPDNCSGCGAEPVYQVCMADSVSLSGAWIDVDKQTYHDAGLYKEYKLRALYTTPQPDRTAELEAELTALKAENESLLKDAERLDWVEHQDFHDLSFAILVDQPNDGMTAVSISEGWHLGNNLREAIDAAMAQPEPVDVEPAMWVMKHIRSGDLAQAKPNQKALHPYMLSDAFPLYTTPQPDRTAELEAALKVARDALRYYGGDKYGTFANEAYAKINEVLK